MSLLSLLPSLLSLLQVQQADAAAGRQGLQEMQQDLTPGASIKELAGDQLKKIYRCVEQFD